MWDKVFGHAALFMSGATLTAAAFVLLAGGVAVGALEFAAAILLFVIAGDRLWGSRRAR